MRPNYVAPNNSYSRCHCTFSSHNQGHRGELLLFLKIALGSCTCIIQHMGSAALRPIQRTKQFLSVVLKDTSVIANQIYIKIAEEFHLSTLFTEFVFQIVPSQSNCIYTQEMFHLAHVPGCRVTCRGVSYVSIEAIDLEYNT